MRGLIYIALLLAALLSTVLPGHAEAQAVEAAAGQLIDLTNQPTGDALWDSYAEALLEHLPLIDERAPYLPYNEGKLRSFFSLPDELLESWEPRFGDDPRYWQLCWWNSISRASEDKESDHDLLYEIRRRGISDPFTEQKLAALELRELNNAWTAREEGLASTEQLALFPQELSGQALVNWYLEAELRQLGELQQRFPQESLFAYELAIEQMEFGEWRMALLTMEAGNAAENNRLLLPFPASFIIEQLETAGSGYDPQNSESSLRLEKALGSRLAAGIAIERIYMTELPHYIRYKEAAKMQLARFALGADAGELDVWQDCILRFGSMQGSPSMQWIHASVQQSIFSHYFLMESPDSLNGTEREGLWQAQQELRPLAGMLEHGLNSSDDLFNPLQMVHLYSGSVPRMQATFESLITVDDGAGSGGAEAAASHYQGLLHLYALEYGRYGDLARQAFAKAGEKQQ